MINIEHTVNIKKWEDRNQDRNRNINHSITTLCADCHKNGSYSATSYMSQNMTTIVRCIGPHLNGHMNAK